ncbi:MAG: transporter substrate-binding domain-containing protein [Amaricoccus sp.]
MRALVALALAALAALPASAGDGGRLQRILDRGRLIVGVKADYPPWGMVAPDGAIVGLEPDLARDLANRLGVGLELVPVTGANRLQRLALGQVDLVIATMGDTPERRRTADLVLPHYYASGVGLMARAATPFHDWGELRGRPVCLSEGAFYNRTLIERYLIEPVVFPGNRDALMALRDGRCVGWAFDDSVLAQLLRAPERGGYRLAMPAILATPWSVAVRKGEGSTAWGRFVADRVAEWHRSGRLVALQARWGLPPSAFLAEERARWSGDCGRDSAGVFPAACLGGPTPVERDAPGGAFLDRFERARLVRGALLTAAVSLVAIAGSLVAGCGLAWALAAAPTGPRGTAVRGPVRALVAVCRMTPPLLQLYIVFFGLGGLVAAGWGAAPGSFAVAALVLSLYAGGSNAALVSVALGQLARERPEVPAVRLLPAAVERCYDGLVAVSVNIVKAAGLASTIALPEAVSAVGALLSEGADAATLMNLLLVGYFLFVLGVLTVLRGGRRLVAGR